MQLPPKMLNMVLRVYMLGNMHIVTTWNIGWGRTVTAMENVVKHKPGSYSGRIDFNKCPEILFSDRKKGLFRTLRENTFHSFHKNMQINSRVKTTKAKKPQKPTNQNNIKYIPSLCLALTLFQNIFLQKSLAIGRWLYFRTCTFIWGTTGGNSIVLSRNLHLQPRTCPYAGSTGKFLHIPEQYLFAHSCCLWYQIQGHSKKLSHIFWRILINFWCAFPFFTFY